MVIVIESLVLIKMSVTQLKTGKINWPPNEGDKNRRVKYTTLYNRATERAINPTRNIGASAVCPPLILIRTYYCISMEIGQ